MPQESPASHINSPLFLLKLSLCSFPQNSNRKKNPTFPCEINLGSDSSPLDVPEVYEETSEIDRTWNGVEIYLLYHQFSCILFFSLSLRDINHFSPFLSSSVSPSLRVGFCERLVSGGTLNSATSQCLILKPPPSLNSLPLICEQDVRINK